MAGPGREFKIVAIDLWRSYSVLDKSDDGNTLRYSVHSTLCDGMETNNDGAVRLLLVKERVKELQVGETERPLGLLPQPVRSICSFLSASWQSRSG